MLKLIQMASPKTRLTSELRNKIPGQSVTGVVERESGRAYVGRAGDTDEAVAE